jgi:polysaccharide deacetylase family protein (PEP-CTERM system associated)
LKPETPIVNALTVDVEDYFQVSAFADHIPRAQWDRLPCRVERNVDAILELFDRHRTHATFFTLGWLAERYPQLVRRIAESGHEVASHGYAHHRASDQSREHLLEDLTKSKHILEQTIGMPVRGYRAPSFSIGERNAWAFDCIVQAGYVYSSSVYPIRHDHYGMPNAPRFPYKPREGLLELPVTTARLFNANLPAGGGGYFRLMPYPMSRWLLRQVHARDGRPAIFYFHPWEVDPEQPRVQGVALKTRVRHYINLSRTQHRLNKLLSDFRWDRVDRVFLEAAA